ncbi:MAG TPA: NTP transferase domain-containing protein [Gemmatimonadales bacterium]|nr:NTP transferase domain-containing protein [Gemmatimonadales bacterium]
MHGLILAGGEGSRLAATGISTPKPLVAVAGRAQVVRLAQTLYALGCGTVTVVVREEFAAAVRAALPVTGLPDVRVESCHTPSSLHTLAQGLAALPAGPVLCTLVDSVMRGADWERVAISVRVGLAAGRALMLAVTAHVDDESPLWVRRTPLGDATWLGSDPVTPPCVTGGVYGFSEAGRALVRESLDQGASRLRGFLSWAAARRTAIGTVDVGRIIDLDRRQDLAPAEQLLRHDAAREMVP